MMAFVGILTLLTLLNGSAPPTFAQKNESNLSGEFAVDPLNATYSIEGNAVRLQDGRSEMAITPHSAITIKTSVYGKTVYGDLDGDGHEDAALLLVHDPGGSGTFYYVAGALNRNGTFRGTNAVLLGDRITPRDLRIRNGVLLVQYDGRRPGEPMSATPSAHRSKYLILKQAQLESLPPLGDGAQVVEGWITIGHEVRSFQPCLWKKELWLQGDSPALSQIMAAYNEARRNSKPYVPLFMVLVGKTAMPLAHGFGAEYEAAFLATQLMLVRPGGHCSRSDFASDAPVLNEGVDVTMRTQQKITFDVTSLDQDGLYGPPNGKRALSYEFCIPGYGAVHIPGQSHRFNSAVHVGIARTYRLWLT